ncbi:MAG TPA: anti-sigma factor [Myxococcota bacterium]|nr:anti-sigma factor [Myxococcota bacterium]
MKHGEVRDRLGPYLEGDLPLQQRALVDAHLDTCPSCAEELKELRGTIGLLRSLPEIEPPTGLARSVIARIEEGEGQPTLSVRLLDTLDMLLRSRRLALSAAAAGVAALALLAPGWFVEQIRPPQAPVVTTAASEASDQALSSRLAPLNIWTAQAPLVHRPFGASASREEPATPGAEGAEPSPVGPELGAMDAEIDRVLRDPSQFVEELSQLPLAERDRQLSALVAEASRAGRAAEIVERLRTTGDHRADAIADGFERTSSSASPR